MAMSKKTLGFTISPGGTGAERRSSEGMRVVAEQKKTDRCGLSLYNSPVGGKTQPITAAKAINQQPCRPIRSHLIPPFSRL